ncbi:MAG: hypothetical protein HOJ55_05665, partial [Euryarchaeota archaeon]|nr:hypothetical protein [Euryarchaeota archaeon]
MKKSLVMFLVATLLLAGCTELLDSGDGETKNIEINEDIALEKIDDFMTVDEGESFGVTMMYDMDPAMMGMDEFLSIGIAGDSEAIITMEMTEAWSPEGYHTSEISGISSGGSSIKIVETMTHIGTTMYLQIGYETTGNICATEEAAVKEINSTLEEKYGQDWESSATGDELEEAYEAYGKADSCAYIEQMMETLPVSAYSMTTSTTHTEVIAAMAEETGDDADMGPMAMLEFLSYVECSSSFTPTDSVDDLQIFNVSMEGMNDDNLSPEIALCLADTDDSGGISFEEFMIVDETDQSDMDAMQTAFDDADANADDELSVDELESFIEIVDAHYGDDDEYDDGYEDEGSDEMPPMKIAFNNAGEIEYFEMEMEGTAMKMFVLTEDRVDSFFTNVDAGELVALPFSISDSMDDDWDDVMDGGEDEDTTDGSDNGGDNGEDQDSEDDGPSPQDLLDMTDTDDSGLMDFDEFITFMSESDETGSGPGESMPQSVIDEFEQMFNISDLDESGDLDHDELEQFILDLTDYLDDDSGSDDYEMWTFHRDMSECDDDADGMVDFDELDGCVTMDLSNDGYGDEGVDGLRWMFDLVDADEDGMLDSDEFEDFAEMTSGEPMMVCYDRYADEIDSSVTSEEDCEAADFNWIQALQPVNEGEDDSEEDEFMCNDGSTIPMSFVNDGDEDCDGGEDEDDMGGSDDEFMCDDGSTIPMNYVNDGDEDCAGGEDEDDMGGSDGNTFYIETSQDVMIPFEGDMSDYKIELTTCRDDYNPDTMGSDTTCGESVMSIAISDAGENSDIMFHDADNSGTISVGDMIHIGETT